MVHLWDTFSRVSEEPGDNQRGRSSNVGKIGNEKQSN